MNVVVDCSEYVHSLLMKNGKGVHRAVWTHDDYLAIQAFSGAFHEFMFNHLLRLLWNKKCGDEIEAEMRRMNRTYLKDSPFYHVIRPWLKESVLREMDKPAERRAARRREA
jgi:hypothetical protein